MGFLLLLFSLANLQNLLIGVHLFEVRQEWLFLPIWYTLSFGPLIFYYTKYSLYPSYQFRWTDLKHFILPILQIGIYLVAFLQPEANKVWLLEHYISPFFKTFEGSLYVVSFFSYLALSYRYLKFKEVSVKKKGYTWERHKIRWHKQMVRVLFLLAGLNTFYVVTDFVAYNWLNINMYNVPGYAALGDLSFAAMLAWLCFHAWSLAMRAPYVRRYKRRIDPWTDLFWSEWKVQKWFLDPDIRPVHLCKRYGIKPSDFSSILDEQKNFQELVEAYRLKEVKHLLGHHRYRRFTWSSIGFLAGYFSANQFQQVFQEATGMSPLEYQQQTQTSSLT